MAVVDQDLRPVRRGADVPSATFLLSAPDQPGLVARFAGFFWELGLNIVDSSNHGTRAASPRFHMRIVVDLSALSTPKALAVLGESTSRRALEAGFDRLAKSVTATWSVGYSDIPPKIALLVTKESACLYDLALRQKQGELPCEIALVISNHPTLESVAEGFRLPFFTLPVTPDTKRDQESKVLELLRKHHVSLVVMARYMQVLTSDFLSAAPPVINIHHGFLPAFQGARPYQQAFDRGVKLVGATAHYATADLDEGPIIEQDVVRVTHAMGPEELSRVGRDVERVVLSRAVRAHLENRVVVEGRRTLVL
ncbi:MAG: formyltetrahydrofolate deformylase [Proteobacteria bacterium]|nr:formyltetrahydrofolate deformylase [Pseudomonadota bacterium]